MARRTLVVTVLTVGLLAAAGPALACGGLLSPNGSVNLLRTTTLAAYVSGVEHYVTAFRFVGGGGARFGSIVPLPGVPTSVEKGGDWTLQRLVREVRPPVLERDAIVAGARAAVPEARVLLETTVDALDITVLEGGGAAIARWAEANGFTLTPDAPEVLDFYARRSPIFLAARFSPERAQAQGLAEGDSTPIHVTIPTPNPWVPLRILALGKQPEELVQADVFLLTEREPAMLPAALGARAPRPAPRTAGLRLVRSEPAGAALLADLRADRGMRWLPARGMWLSYLELEQPAADLDYDLAVDASGAGQPSRVAAGLPDAVGPGGAVAAGEAVSWVAMLALGAVLGGVAGFLVRGRLASGARAPAR
jgi:hypothetical protein